MTRTLTLAVLLLAAMFAAEARAAGPEETFEPGTGKYLLVLLDGDTETVDKKTGKKAKEPDVAKHGGKVLAKTERARVIKLPVAAAKAMRKEENVAYMQRIWLGESLENWDPQDPAPAAVADSEFDSLEEDLTWSTGQFLYDGSGNIKKIGNDTYSYDSAGRLIKAVVTGVTETYQYDSFGNLTEKKIGSAPGPVRVDSSSNRLTGELYDAAGNVTTRDGAPRYKYDSLNMMDEVDIGLGSTRRMIYGPDEERIAVIHDENLMRWTFRDFDGRVLREYRADCCAWEWLEDYVYGEGRLLAGERMPFFRGKRHFHTDHLGTVRLITDQNTRSISRHDFLPFGIEQTDSQYERKSSTMDGDYRARTDPMKYTSHEREFLGWYNYENTDYLDYMHARFYDPNRGRFLSVDPGNDVVLMQPQTWNKYAYVRNNPVHSTDPTGMFTMVIDVKAINDRVDTALGWFSDGMQALSDSYTAWYDARPTDTWWHNHQLRTMNDSRAARGDVPHLSFEECRASGECLEPDDIPMMVGGLARLPRLAGLNRAQLKHMFRNSRGHVNPSTLSSQTRFLNLYSKVAGNPANRVAPDNAREAAAGLVKYVQKFNGGEVWVKVLNGKVVQGGVNR